MRDELIGMAALHCWLAKADGHTFDKKAMRFTAMADHMEHTAACGDGSKSMALLALPEAVETAIVGSWMHIDGQPFDVRPWKWMENPDLEGTQMNAQEITKRLYAIGEAFLAKTGEKLWSDASLTIKDNKCEIILNSGWVGGKCMWYATIIEDTPEAAIDAAFEIIASFPPPEVTMLNAFMANLADCIDKAHADGIDDEYIKPLRLAIKAMSDNLLTMDTSE